MPEEKSLITCYMQKFITWGLYNTQICISWVLLRCRGLNPWERLVMTRRKNQEREVQFGLCLLCTNLPLVRQHSVPGFPSLLIPAHVPNPFHPLSTGLTNFLSQSHSEHRRAGLPAQTTGYHSVLTKTWCHTRLEPQKVLWGFTSVLSLLLHTSLDLLLATGRKKDSREERLLEYVYASKSLVPAPLLPRKVRKSHSIKCPALSQGLWSMYWVFLEVYPPFVF